MGSLADHSYNFSGTIASPLSFILPWVLPVGMLRLNLAVLLVNLYLSQGAAFAKSLVFATASVLVVAVTDALPAPANFPCQ